MRPARRRSRVRRTLPGQLSVLLSLLSLLIAWSLTNLTPMARADGRSPLLGGSEAGPAPIVLDGRTLFRIWPSGNLSAEQRSAAINQRLAEAAAGETTAAIEVGTQNNLPVLLLNGRTLLTVTERDVPEGLEATEQAKAWRQGLEAAGPHAGPGRTQPRPSEAHPPLGAGGAGRGRRPALGPEGCVAWPLSPGLGPAAG